MRRYRISTDKARERLDGCSSIPCEQCKYFHVRRSTTWWLEMCEVTGGRVIGSDEVKSDNCPFMEVKDE